jgi:hypothetical protein
MVSDIINRNLYLRANFHPIVSQNKDQLFSHLAMPGVKRDPLVSTDCREMAWLPTDLASDR